MLILTFKALMSTTRTAWLRFFWFLYLLYLLIKVLLISLFLVPSISWQILFFIKPYLKACIMCNFSIESHIRDTTGQVDFCNFPQVYWCFLELVRIIYKQSNLVTFLKFSHSRFSMLVNRSSCLSQPFWRVWNAAGSDGRGVIGIVSTSTLFFIILYLYIYIYIFFFGGYND